MEHISEADDLYRRLAPGHLGPDGKPTSNAYKKNGKPDPEASVDLARLTTRQESLNRATGPGFLLGSISASKPFEMGLGVEHKPLPDNYSHSQILGASTRTHCRELADATFVISADTADN